MCGGSGGAVERVTIAGCMQPNRLEHTCACTQRQCEGCALLRVPGRDEEGASRGSDLRRRCRHRGLCAVETAVSFVFESGRTCRASSRPSHLQVAPAAPFMMTGYLPPGANVPVAYGPQPTPAYFPQPGLMPSSGFGQGPPAPVGPPMGYPSAAPAGYASAPIPYGQAGVPAPYAPPPGGYLPGSDLSGGGYQPQLGYGYPAPAFQGGAQFPGGDQPPLYYAPNGGAAPPPMNPGYVPAG